MDKIAIISGKEVTFRSVATLPRMYKMYFQRDFFEDLNLMSDIQYVIKNVLKEGKEENVFEKLAWVMAKSYDPSLPDVERWKATFDEFNMKDVVKEVQGILSVTIGANKQQAKTGTTGTAKTNTELFLIMCKDVGLTNDDLESMTLGMCLDFIDEYLQVKHPDQKPKFINAQQAHFDKF